jgi:lipopolysaccharide export system permease protein
MTTLLDRYIARQFVNTFLALVLGLPFLFIVTDLTDNLDRYISQGLNFQAVVRAEAYQLPLFLYYSFPIAALVATVFTIGAMTRYQEITAAKAGGVSFYRLLRPIVTLALVLSGLALGLSELVPVTTTRRMELLGKKSRYSDNVKTNFVFQTEHNGVLSARSLDLQRGEMNDVVLESEGDAEAPGVHQSAAVARWEPGTGWNFDNGYLRVLRPDGSEANFQYTTARMPSLSETPNELLAEPKKAEEMRYAEMTRFIRAIERSGGNPLPMLVERAQKLALPLAVLVIVLFGAPLVTSSRRGGAAYGIGLSLGITLVYLMLFRVGKAVGSSGALTPDMAAWMPNALFFAGAVVLLWRVRT